MSVACALFVAGVVMQEQCSLYSLRLAMVEQEGLDTLLLWSPAKHCLVTKWETPQNGSVNRIVNAFIVRLTECDIIEKVADAGYECWGC